MTCSKVSISLSLQAYAGTGGTTQSLRWPAHTTEVEFWTLLRIYVTWLSWAYQLVTCCTLMCSSAVRVTCEYCVNAQFMWNKLLEFSIIHATGAFKIEGERRRPGSLCIKHSVTSWLNLCLRHPPAFVPVTLDPRFQNCEPPPPGGAVVPLWRGH
jgi:hypothetical protein